MTPEPPAVLKLNIGVVPAGTQLHRVHDPAFKGAEFNPCMGRPTRFAPIYRPDSSCIPTLYAAETFEAALFESVFHDVPLHKPRKAVRQEPTMQKAYSVVEAVRDLNVAQLHPPDLGKINLRANQLIDTYASQYPKTAKWAAAIHEDPTIPDGLVYTSTRCSPVRAFLFYGSPSRADLGFRVVSTRVIGSEDALMGQVVRAAMRAGIALTV